MSPEALVFDAYGTLFDVHSVVQRCEALWPGEGTRVSQLWRAKQLEWTWQRSLMRRYVPFSQITRDALAYACDSLALKLGSAELAALMDEYLRLAVYPDVPEALRRLAGRKLAVLSNGSPDMLEPLVRNCGLDFESVLSVDELRIYKPAPEVYELAVRKLNVPREEIGFVSSNCWDALGAKSYGFRAWWIRRSGAPVDRLDFEPDAVLKNLGELPEILL
jgi:2-haloacid dehalogenase